MFIFFNLYVLNYIWVLLNGFRLFVGFKVGY